MIKKAKRAKKAKSKKPSKPTPIKKTVKKVAKKTAKVKPVKKTKAKKPKRLRSFKLESKPLTEEQIKLFVEHYNNFGTFPGSKIPCNITGKLSSCVGAWLKKKIQEYGNAENLLRKYHCRGAIKKVKKQKNERKKLMKVQKDEKGEYIVPKLKPYERRYLSKSDTAEMTKSMCLRPDIHLDNDYACNGCPFLDVCQNKNKRMIDPKKPKTVYKKKTFVIR